jgi:hypothetical protein
MHNRILAMALVGLLATATGASAAGKWPSTARPVLTPKVTCEPFDGGEIAHLTLEGGGTRFRTNNLTSLRLAERDPRYSVTFEHIRIPGSTISLTLFNRTEFLTSIDSPSWDSYLTSLRYLYPIAFEVISDRPPEETARGFPVMGMPYRELTIRYLPYEGGDPVVRRETFILMEDKLLVASLQAPENHFATVEPTVRTLLVGLDRQK